jgi:hypothetical protein
MKLCSVFIFLLLASAFGAAAAGTAAEDPPEGRVPLIIRAADPDGGELQFSWVQLEGPTVQIADPKARRFDKTQCEVDFRNVFRSYSAWQICFRSDGEE